MVESTSRITAAEVTASSPAHMSGKQSDRFDGLLDIEKADDLLRRTDQYQQWQVLCQNHDPDLPLIARQILRYNDLSQHPVQGDFSVAQQLELTRQQLSAKGIELTKVNDQGIVPPTASTGHTTPVHDLTSLLNEENLLILDLDIPVVNVRKNILGYGDGHTAILPLETVIQALDFKISVNAEEGKAQGWFVDENRRFSLDAVQQTVSVEGNVYPVNSGDIVVADDDIYVNASLLSKWFPVNFEVSYSDMAVTLTPREKLPLQEQFEREQKRTWLRNPGDMSVKYDLTQTPYQWFSFPVIDFSASLGTGTNTKDNTSSRPRYSIVAEGDLAKMGAELFISGYEDEPINTARVRLSRFDYDAGLLGPLKATQVVAGDFFPAEIPGLTNAGIEKGVYISNNDLSRSSNFDTTRFEGNLQPGWDVELYRRDKLVRSIRVGTDGRYIFDDIPLFFGENKFKLIAFGTQGQRRVLEDKSINVGSTMLPKDAFEYELSATQRNKTILGIDERNSLDTNNGARITGSMRYGLNENYSVSTGFSSVEFADVRHNYFQTGIGGSIFSAYGQADYIVDTESGSGVSLLGQTTLGPIGLRAKHESYFDFIEETRPNKALKSRTSFSLGGYTPEYTYFPPFSYTLSNTNTSYTDRDIGQLTARLSTHIKSTNISNLTTWAYSDATTLVNGDLVASTSLNNGSRLTGGVNYVLGDENEVSGLRFSSYHPLSHGLSLGTGLYHYMGENNEHTNINLSLDWDAGMFNLSPSISYDTEEGAGAFLTMSFSLGPDPVKESIHMRSNRRSGKGGAEAFVYHDLNNNKIYDGEDVPLPEVEVVARQAGNRAETDKDGVAYLLDMREHNATDIEIDVDSLEDPFWNPTVSGVSLVPRSGRINTVEFPVVTTGEIDGTVYLADKDGNQDPISGVTLQIINTDGDIIQSVTSEYDGFYLFEKVVPGDYTLRIAKPENKNGRYSGVEPVEITIGNDGTIASGNDIILRKPETQLESRKQEWLSPEPITSISQPLLAEIKGTVSNGANTATLVTNTTTVSIQPLQIVHGSKLAGIKKPKIISTANIANSTLSVTATNIKRNLNNVSDRKNTLATSEKKKNNITSPPVSKTDSKADTSAQLQITTPNYIITRPLAIVAGTQEKTAANEPSATKNDPRAYQPLNTIIPPVIKHFNPLGDSIAIASDSSTKITRITNLERRHLSKEDPIISQSVKYNNNISIKSQPAKPNNDPEKTLTGDFGVHLASFRTEDSARKGVGVLADRLSGIAEENKFTVKKVYLGTEKGTWYRVIYGPFQNKAEADKIAQVMQPRTEYAKPILIERPVKSNIHIASLRNPETTFPEFKEKTVKNYGLMTTKLATRHVVEQEG